MKRYLRAAPGVFALASLLPGCGVGDPEAETGGEISGPHRMILNNKRFQDPNYKKMIGKDGKMIWSPGMSNRPPPGTPRR